MRKASKQKIFVKQTKDKPSLYQVDLLSPELRKPQQKRKSRRQKTFFQKKNTNKKKKNNIYISVDGQKIEFTDLTKKDNSRKAKDKIVVAKNLDFSAWRGLSVVRLVFFVGKIFGKIFYNVEMISYWTGWLTVFLARLVYFFIKKLFIFLVWPAKYLQTFVFFNLKRKRELKPKTKRSVSHFIATQEQNEPVPVKNDVLPRNKQWSFFSVLRGFTWSDLLPSWQTTNIKSVSSFVLVLLVLTLPLKALTFYHQTDIRSGRVLGVSASAVDEIREGIKQLHNFDFNDAGNNFINAGNNFSRARQDAGYIFSALNVLAKVVPNEKIRLGGEADHILRAGELGALIAGDLSDALAIATAETNQKNIGRTIVLVNDKINAAAENATKLVIATEAIDPTHLPLQYQDKFLSLKKKTLMFAGSLQELSDILSLAKSFLGINSNKRYLLVFQNNAELRGGGGFLGSFALVDFRDGKLVNMEVPAGGSYDTEAGMLVNIAPPQALRLLTSRWYFWDANWWPDWPTTAKKLMWFYEKSDGPTVDGVVGFTPTVIEKLLQITGPLNLQKKYNVTINSDNFWQITQTFSEQKPIDHPAYEPNPYLDIVKDQKQATGSLANENKPKEIIGDMFNELLRVLPQKMNQEKLFSLLKVFIDSVTEKHLLLYFNDPQMEKAVIDFGWDGAIRKNQWDYLQIVDSNIGGGKSDRVISEDIKHNIDIYPDGSIVDTVKITRKHKAYKGERFVGVRNLDWLRIYVPLGSKLIFAKGFLPPDTSLFSSPDKEAKVDPYIAVTEESAIRDNESWTYIYNEGGKTVFANWSQLEPGETAVITLRYRLPFNLFDKNEPIDIWDSIDDLLAVDKNNLHRFALTLQKQPGVNNRTYSGELSLPDNCQIIWSYPLNLNNTGNGWQTDFALKSDKFFAGVLQCVGPTEYINKQ